MSLRPCLDCGRPTTGTRCDQCAEPIETADNHRRQEIAREHGLHSSHWRTLKKERLELARGMCELRLNGCTGKAMTVHLAPALAGDHRTATLSDCRAACLHCHGVVDAPRASRRGHPEKISSARGAPTPFQGQLSSVRVF